jgi:hypothetical protein
MYRKKRNKRSALRLSGINIPKNALLPSQLPAPVSSSEEEDMDGIEEEDRHDIEEVHYDVREEDGREQDHWNANDDEANEVHSDSRSPMLDTIDKQIEPTVCSLLDGTVELALAKVFPSQKACHSVPVQDGYVVVQPTYVWANTSHKNVLNWSVSCKFCSQKFNLLVFLIGIADHAGPLVQYSLFTKNQSLSVSNWYC